MLGNLPRRVSIFEVSPRDGLQNEAHPVPLEDKKALVTALVDAGIKRIELTSFVSPRWIPQLADADELVRSMKAPPGVSFSALCPNTKGLERAVEVGLHEVAVFLSASETHNLKNTNKSIERSLEVFDELVPHALEAKMRVRGYVSTVWGCPYEGAVDPARALDIGKHLLGLGCYQVSLGDTIGVGTPLQTQRICELFLKHFEPAQLALHLHDTRGTALANALAGLEMGITDFDASIAGLGGCPYAPGAAGNLATEDIAYMLAGMGIETGIDLPALLEAGHVAETIVGRKLPGKVHQAGLPGMRTSGESPRSARPASLRPPR
ncbi:MAG TPA: hydroxymethylglutaryl-CoA lyase [Polyangiaceae bacterium]|jgi:hydroxymethylglutaryl-CoA lyase|nr:hydroxymethylglutaryl-CoA lyase [Polyangiaceae bacterium]